MYIQQSLQLHSYGSVVNILVGYWNVKMGCDNVGSQHAESTRNSWNRFPRHGPLPKNAEAVQKSFFKKSVLNILIQGVHIYVVLIIRVCLKMQLYELPCLWKSIYHHYHHHHHLLQLSFHLVAVVLTLVTNKNKYTWMKQYKKTVNTSTHSTKTSTNCQNTHTYTQPHITKPIHTPTYRVIHKSLRDFRTRLRNNQDRHGRKEHINR